MDIRLALMTGIDVPIPELQLVLHQPTIQEISFLGEQDFFTAVHLLTLDKESLIEDESVSSQLTNFQVLMKVIEQMDANKKAPLLTLFSLLFPACKTVLMPKSIILMNGETSENIMIDDNNFQVLQDTLKEVLCVSNLFQGNNIVYKPANAEAKRIADKIMRGRRKVAEMKEKSNDSVFARYISILSVGLASMTVQDCISLTMFQLFDLVERFTLFTEWDIDLRVRLAGGSPKTEAENWMKNIH